MNITCNSQVLAHEVRLLSKIVPGKSAHPVLNNILFRANGNLTLAATDLQISMTTACDATITQPGEVTLPAKKLMDMLEQLPDSDVNIVLEKGHVRIKAGAFKSRLQSLSAQDFPTIPSSEGDIAILPAAALRQSIERTEYAISEKTAQYVLKGALLSLFGEVFAMVTTDGKRLSISTAVCSKGPSCSALIPDKTLDTLLTHCEGKDIEFSTNGQHLFFTAGKRLLVSGMLAGQFPAYERIIPKNNDKRLMLDRIAFTAALKRVGAVSDEDRSMKLSCTSGAMHLTARSAGIGDAEEEIPMIYEGDPLIITVNGKYVLDFLERATQPNITIDTKSATSPLLFTDGPDFVNVIMVMR